MMEDNSLPVGGLPGWMQIGVSVIVFVFAAAAGIWGHLNRQQQHHLPIPGDDGSNDEEMIEILRAIAGTASKICDQMQRNQVTTERLLFLMEERHQNENLDRIFEDKIGRMLPEIIQKARDARESRGPR
jgi:hypothetical protein